MPSAHPIPSLAALALSLYVSDKRVERLPRMETFDRTHVFPIKFMYNGQLFAPRFAGYEEI